MKQLLAVAAIFEGVTGVALLISPELASQLLLGTEVSGAGAAITRVAGCALLALGLACWPGREATRHLAAALRGMLVYNLLVTGYLALLGIGGQFLGILLWPAVVAHSVLTVLFVREWLKARRTKGDRPA